MNVFNSDYTPIVYVSLFTSEFKKALETNVTFSAPEKSPSTDLSKYKVTLKTRDGSYDVSIRKLATLLNKSENEVLEFLKEEGTQDLLSDLIKQTVRDSLGSIETSEMASDKLKEDLPKKMAKKSQEKVAAVFNLASAKDSIVFEPVFAPKQRVTHHHSNDTNFGFAVQQNRIGELFALVKIELGEGTFKKVTRAINLHTLQQTAYARVLLADMPEHGMTAEEMKEQLLDEIRMCQIFKNDPEFVKILHYCEYLSKDSQITKFGIMYELCELGSLFACEHSLNDEDILSIAQDLLHALDKLEQRGVLHRDLKLENILIYRDEQGKARAKIGDFGCASFRKEGDLASNMPGTLMYFSPEYVRQKKNVITGNAKIAQGEKQIAEAQNKMKLLREGKIPCNDLEAAIRAQKTLSKKGRELIVEGNHLISKAAETHFDLGRDQWALGIVLYHMITKSFPPYIESAVDANTFLEQLTNLKQSDVDGWFKDNPKLNTPLGNICKQLLSIDSNARPAGWQLTQEFL